MLNKKKHEIKYTKILKRSGGHSCVDLYLDPLSYFIDIHVCLCDNTILFINMAVWYMWYNLKSDVTTPPASFFLFSVALSICSLSCFHVESEIFSVSLKNNPEIFTGT